MINDKLREAWEIYRVMVIFTHSNLGKCKKVNQFILDANCEVLLISGKQLQKSQYQAANLKIIRI